MLGNFSFSSSGDIIFNVQYTNFEVKKELNFENQLNL